jgi:hypothetical protein
MLDRLTFKVNADERIHDADNRLATDAQLDCH